jgi:hypothetical protein
MTLKTLLEICDDFENKIADKYSQPAKLMAENYGYNGNLRVHFVVEESHIYFVFDFNYKSTNVKDFECIENFSDLKRALRHFQSVVDCNYEDVICVLSLTSTNSKNQFEIKNVWLKTNVTVEGVSEAFISLK